MRMNNFEDFEDPIGKALNELEGDKKAVEAVEADPITIFGGEVITRSEFIPIVFGEISKERPFLSCSYDKGKPSKTKWATDLDSALQHLDALDGAEINNYFCVGVGSKLPSGRYSRVTENIVSKKSLAIDLDVGVGVGEVGNKNKKYVSKLAACRALHEAIETNQLPMPSVVVDSGGGMHAYWSCDTDIAIKDWKAIADGFKKYLGEIGLLQDPCVTADATRVLRTPDSHNYKDTLDKPMPVVAYKSGSEFTLDEMQGLVLRAGSPSSPSVGGSIFEEGGSIDSAAMSVDINSDFAMPRDTSPVQLREVDYCYRFVSLDVSREATFGWRDLVYATTDGLRRAGLSVDEIIEYIDTKSKTNPDGTQCGHYDATSYKQITDLVTGFDGDRDGVVLFPTLIKAAELAAKEQGVSWDVNLGVLEGLSPIDRSASKIKLGIEAILKSRVVGIDTTKCNVSISIITSILKTSFYSPSNNKIVSMNSRGGLGVLNDYIRGDYYKCLTGAHGAIFNEVFVRGAATAADLSKGEITNLIADCREVLTMYFVLDTQYKSLSNLVDMFADIPRVDLLGDEARAVYTFPKLYVGKIDPVIIADYKDHFPEFDEVVKWVCDCRFASNRKNGYLWLHAPSDWGKTFFVDLFREQGLAVELTEAEVENMVDNKPVGRDPKEFSRAFMVIFNELRYVNNSMKTLERDLKVTPKYSMTTTVPVYAKLLISADDVESLLSEDGVEAQMANRINMIEVVGKVTDRVVFGSVGRHAYFASIKHYVAQEINNYVVAARAVGVGGITKAADDGLDEMFSRRGLANTHDVVEDNVDKLCEEIVMEAVRCVPEAQFEPLSDTRNLFPHCFFWKDGDLCLSKGSKFFERWVEETKSKAEQVKIKKRKSAALRMLSEFGEKPKNRKAAKYNGVKSIKIDPKWLVGL